MWPQLQIPPWALLLTGVAAFLGHLFPIFLKFKGGKGVATSFGVVLGFWPLYTLAGIGATLVFLLILFLWRYISLSSIIGALAFPILVLTLARWINLPILVAYRDWSALSPPLAVATLLAALIIIRHRSNIRRLIAGTESKIGQKKTNSAPDTVP